MTTATRRAGTVVLGTLALLLVLEIGLRLVAFVGYGYSRYYLLYGLHALAGRVDVSPWSTFTGAHYKFPPHYVLRGAVGQAAETATINALGFRGRDFEPRKPPGVFRIVCLGESSTFGFHNSDTGTYPYLLQTLFEPRPGRPRVEVINGGFPYYNTGSILSLLRAEVLEYEPDLLTLYAAFNDASWPLQVGPITRMLLWVQRHSITYLLLKEHVVTDERVMVAKRAIDKWIPWKLGEAALNRYADEVARRYRRNVAEILALARARGIGLIVIRQPMRARSNRRKLTYEQEHELVLQKLRHGRAISSPEFTLVVHHRLLAELDRLAAEHHLPVVDNVAIVDADPRRLATYVHLTEEGNLRLAEALRAAIVPEMDRRLGGGSGPRAAPPGRSAKPERGRDDGREGRHQSGDEHHGADVHQEPEALLVHGLILPLSAPYSNPTSPR